MNSGKNFEIVKIEKINLMFLIFFRYGIILFKLDLLSFNMQIRVHRPSRLYSVDTDRITYDTMSLSCHNNAITFAKYIIIDLSFSKD